MSGLDELFLDSTLAGIDEEAPPSQIETVLRSVASAIADADPLALCVAVVKVIFPRFRPPGVLGIRIYKDVRPTGQLVDGPSGSGLF